MIFLTRQLERTVLVHMYTEFIISVQKKILHIYDSKVIQLLTRRSLPPSNNTFLTIRTL